jgi:hypothetical protein
MSGWGREHLLTSENSASQAGNWIGRRCGSSASGCCVSNLSVVPAVGKTSECQLRDHRSPTVARRSWSTGRNRCTVSTWAQLEPSNGGKDRAQLFDHLVERRVCCAARPAAPVRCRTFAWPTSTMRWAKQAEVRLPDEASQVFGPQDPPSLCQPNFREKCRETDQSDHNESALEERGRGRCFSRNLYRTSTSV